jgi:hypothetical protein
VPDIGSHRYVIGIDRIMWGDDYPHHEDEILRNTMCATFFEAERQAGLLPQLAR